MANSTRIVYNALPSGGIHVANAARALLTVRQELALAKALMNAITGGGVTGANLEGSSEFGVAVGQGQALYDCVSGMLTNVNTVTDAELMKILQG
jgi:hypothetical protein